MEHNCEEAVKKYAETNERVLLFAQTMQYIQTDIKEIKEKLDNKYVTKEEFSTVKSIAYGFVGLICTTVGIAMLVLIIR